MEMTIKCVKLTRNISFHRESGTATPIISIVSSSFLRDIFPCNSRFISRADQINSFELHRLDISFMGKILLSICALGVCL
ncbi:hypothetical protein PROFUN_06576 [Planoprotostelium fungivorum]|uniref:Uncharacterized protein n=1 Tax=Planoprotostelium fungivorum TaxID=1890364 RepID=A0A2P6MRX4_9EUKA|nr:hypothetical protein PROFUN_06576 [Planoprotostelium fungivorum]